jgi:methionine biosynthesis protein MetW
MNATVSDYYDRYWSAAETPRYEPGAELMSRITRRLGADSDVLDVGCGAGNSYAPSVVAATRSYVGVDVSVAAVEQAQAAGLDARVIDDAAALPFDDESFDLAICVEVLEHLFEPGQVAREIWRVLRPGGALVASAPNAVYWRHRLNAMLGRWNPAGDALSIEQPWRDPHIRFFSLASMERMLLTAGFSTAEADAHGGCFLDHLTSRPTAFGQGRAYRAAERRFPSLLGMTIDALAVK